MVWKKAFAICSLWMLVLLSSCSALGIGEAQSSPTPMIPTASPTPSPQTDIAEGDAHTLKSDFSAAIAAYEQALIIDPNSVEAHAKLSLAHYWLGIDLNAASYEAETAKMLAPEDPFALAVLANIQANAYNLQSAQTNIDQAAQLDPGDPFVQYVQVKVALAQHQYTEAWEILSEALVQNPDAPELYQALGKYFEAVGDVGYAQAAYQKAIDLAPEFVPYQISNAYLFLKRANYDKAIELLNHTLQIHPLPSAYWLLIHAQIGRQDIFAAEETLAIFQEQFPEGSLLPLAEGLVLQYQEAYSEALEKYQAALEISPESLNAQLRIGKTYLTQEDCISAKFHFEEMADIYPDALEFTLGRAYAGLCEQDIDLALTYFRDVLREDKYNADAYLGLGNIYSNDENYEADEVFNNALKYSPDLSVVHALIAQDLYFHGYLESAETEIKTAITQDPYQGSYHTLLSHIYLEYNEIELAREEAEAAAALEPNNSQAWFLSGLIAYELGNLEKAKENMQQVLDLEPDFHQAHLYLGLIARDQNDHSVARQEITTYITNTEDEQTEETLFLLDNLRDSLGIGFKLYQNDILSVLNSQLSILFPNEYTLQNKDIPSLGTTLRITFPVSQSDIDDKSFLEKAMLAITLAAFQLPRSNEPFEGGVQIIFTVRGQETFAINVTTENLSKYYDTRIGMEELISTFTFALAPEEADADNYESIIEDVVQLRELPLDEIPPQMSITAEELTALNVSSMDDMVIENIQREENFLEILGLIPEDYDLVQGYTTESNSNVAGFYTPSNNEIYLIEQEEWSNIDQITLAHEITHAIQDQAFDLGDSSVEQMNDDEKLARLALIEGDATLTTFLYMLENVPDINLLPYSSFQGETSTGPEAPSFLVDLTYFPYFFGEDFVRFLYTKDGWEEVNNAFENLPTSSEQILHPQKYINGEEPIPVSLEGLAEKLGPQWEETLTNVLGEYGIYLMLSEYLGSYAASDPSDGWGGDQYVLLENTEDGSQALAMQITWDSKPAAERFRDFFTIAMTHRKDYLEIAETFSLEPDTRIWTDGEETILMQHTDEDVYLVYAGNLDLAHTIMDLLIQE